MYVFTPLMGTEVQLAFDIVNVYMSWVFIESDILRVMTCVKCTSRTRDKVQRFRITRYDTGYYIFGGRPFSR